MNIVLIKKKYCGSFAHAETMALNLLKLPEDALVEIYIDYTVSELMDLASTSARLKNIARKVFSLRYQRIRLDSEKGWSVIGVDCNGPREKILHIFQNFGDLLKKLEVVFSGADKSFNTSVFNSMVKHCSGTLEDLQISGTRNLQPNEVADATALFREVKRFKLIGSDAFDALFLSKAKKLENLVLMDMDPADAIQLLSHDYQLQSLQLHGIFPPLDPDEMKNTMMRHTSLTKIDFFGPGPEDLSWIGELTQLRELYYTENNDGEVNFQPIARLEHLTTLVTGDIIQQVEELFTTFKSCQSLEELAFGCYMQDGRKFMTALSQFNNLKILRIRSLSPEESHLEELNGIHFAYLHLLQNLRDLIITGSLSITTDDLVKLVQHLPHLEVLCLDSREKFRRMHLMKSTLLRIGEISRSRNKKLQIWNDEFFYNHNLKEATESAFEGKEQEFTQFFPNKEQAKWIEEVYV